MSVFLLYSESPQFPILDSVWMLCSLIQYDMLPRLCYWSSSSFLTFPISLSSCYHYYHCLQFQLSYLLIGIQPFRYYPYVAILRYYYYGFLFLYCHLILCSRFSIPLFFLCLEYSWVQD